MKSPSRVEEIVLHELRDLSRISSSCWIAEDDIVEVCFKGHGLFLIDTSLALRLMEDDGLIEYDEDRVMICFIDSRSHHKHLFQLPSEEAHS